MMSSENDHALEAQQDGDVEFFKAEPDDLDRVVSVPQAFDNQWVPDILLRQVMAPRRRASDAALERRRLPYVRREYLRGLVNTGQIVINRAFLYNNPAIYRDYAKAGKQRESFKRLLSERVIIPYLFAEPSPATEPDFSRRDSGWKGWSGVVRESAPTCLRLSWGSDEQNRAQIRRLLATPAAQFAKNLDDFEVPVLAAEFGLSPDDQGALGRRLQQVAAWAQSRSASGQRLNREDIYKEFVVASDSDPDDRHYDAGKPFAEVIKKLIDLRYNANLTDALGSYLLTPEDSPRRRALQEWRALIPGGGSTDASRLIDVVSSLRFDQVMAVVGALATFDQLTLSGIIRLRSTEAWHRYHQVLQAFLSEASLDGLGDTMHGAQAVALAYSEVIREAGAITAGEAAARIQRRWDPVIEIMVEFAGGLVSLYYNPGGDGANAFHVAQNLLEGVMTRSAKAVFHLVIGRATRSHGHARVDNNIRMLETRLDHGRRDWEEFITTLERAGFRQLSAVPGSAQDIAAMEKSPEND